MEVLQNFKKKLHYSHIKVKRKPGTVLPIWQLHYLFEERKRVLIARKFQPNHNFCPIQDYLKRVDILSMYHSNDTSNFWVSKMVAITFSNLRKAVSLFTI
jgi:hypothetical protein